MASQMRMNAQFLHEGELLGLIDEIRASVRALIQIRSCTLERIPVNPTIEAIRHNSRQRVHPGVDYAEGKKMKRFHLLLTCLVASLGAGSAWPAETESLGRLFLRRKDGWRWRNGNAPKMCSKRRPCKARP